MFLAELAELLGVAHPDPAGADNEFNQYVFDRAITRQKPDGSATTVYADLYKRGAFILETKQGVQAVEAASSRLLDGLDKRQDAAATKKTGHGIRGTKQWDIALEKAYNQARGYIRDLPAAEGRPPFLIVCDVGYVIELYSEFTCTGGTYIRFPDPKNHRIYLEDLRVPYIRQRLRTIWTDPLSLDPSKHAARVTRDVAEHLARLAKSLEADGHHAESIATFLQRCLFTLFAEDVGLLPENAFLDLLGKLKDNPGAFSITVSNLWKDMASEEEWSVALMQKIAYFNGGLFENATALPLSADQIALLIGAAKPDWFDVEPAIFGTLLERALSPQDRHKLGAHYTPRSYVERLEGEVLELLEVLGDSELTFEMEQFKVRPQQFHGLELNERAVAIAQLVLWIGYFQWHKKTTGTADTKDRPLLPKQQTILRQDAVLAYDEKTPRKRKVSSTNKRQDAASTDQTKQQDAASTVEAASSRLIEREEFVCIWDGRTTKPHPVTGKEVPDESATIPVYDYSNPRRAEWPTFKKDEPLYIVGNPPFIGASRMRDALGDGYTESLRKVWKKDVPESADFVMFWWEQAAELVRAGKAERFGFITTNSIHQTFNRRVVEKHLNVAAASSRSASNKKRQDAASTPLVLALAIPDHPWVDIVDGAAVRIAMTVGTSENLIGQLNRVTQENDIGDGEHAVDLQTQLGKIAANLKIGADLGSATQIKSNQNLSNRGFCLFGKGFIVEPELAEELEQSSKPNEPKVIFDYRNGKDLTQKPREVKVIDAFGYDTPDLQAKHPGVYQHLLTHVKPERDNNKRESRKRYWWLFGEPNKLLREQLAGLPRYIATVETSKHCFFQFLDQSILPDNKLINFALSDTYYLSLLSSSVHVAWVLACGSRLEDRPVYVKTTCFETFPFPDLPEASPPKARLRELGEQLDAHRKKQQSAHPELTMTGMYNVLEKLRAHGTVAAASSRSVPQETKRQDAASTGSILTDKERKIHDDGLVSILKQLHDEIDTATAEAYGWQDLLSEKPLADRLAQGDENLEQQILQRLVDLNHERAAEEALGKIRYLRPEYQDPEYQKTEARGQKSGEQSELEVEAQPKTGKPVTEKLNWPKTLPEQVANLRTLLPETGPDASALAAHFGKRTKKRVQEIDQILETLRNLGQL